MAQRVRQKVTVVDTSALYALVDADDDGHAACAKTLEELAGTVFAVSPFVLAETDYLVAARLGIEAEVALLDDVERNAFRLVDFGAESVGACVPVIRRYRDQSIGLTDASVVVLADRLRTRRIFTLDRRHFDVLRPLSGGRFELLPGS